MPLLDEIVSSASYLTAGVCLGAVLRDLRDAARANLHHQEDDDAPPTTPPHRAE